MLQSPVIQRDFPLVRLQPSNLKLAVDGLVSTATGNAYVQIYWGLRATIIQCRFVTEVGFPWVKHPPGNWVALSRKQSER